MFSRKLKKPYLWMNLASATLTIALIAGCGKESSSGGNVTIQSNPLAGANQGSILSPTEWKLAALGNGLMDLFFPKANAAVSPFNTLKVCVSEIVYELQEGSVGSSETPLQPGLLDFSPTAETAMTIGEMQIAAGSVLKNIKFTIATVPALCQGANYAVLFNAPSTAGDIQVTQDVSFQFDFENAGGYTIEDGATITLMLGDIVNGMVALGNGLDDASIQTVNVGQAR